MDDADEQTIYYLTKGDLSKRQAILATDVETAYLYLYKYLVDDLNKIRQSNSVKADHG